MCYSPPEDQFVFSFCQVQGFSVFSEEWYIPPTRGRESLGLPSPRDVPRTVNLVLRKNRGWGGSKPWWKNLYSPEPLETLESLCYNIFYNLLSSLMINLNIVWQIANLLKTIRAFILFKFNTCVHLGNM